ncbi:transferrin-binding protein-like solute binding protein [Ruegeria lacuscaerulensis]|uniref:transferrin-binding protein-like solute binding protein n=1 Tax=Ruegeria lacuscaerulensis TaxID=55218 RepID=UPI00147AFF3F|nr:transferrin-binding protein-like solute binding protein [Ruegeria lacuscaerulensis]
MADLFIFRTISGALACTALTACLGSESIDSGATVKPFNGFSNIPDNGTTDIDGQAVTANYVADPTTGEVVITNPSGPSQSTTRVVTRNGTPVALTASAPGSSVSFDTRNGDTRIDAPFVTGYVTADGQDSATFINPGQAGYEYQTYGAWVTGAGTGAGTVGAGSYGLKTEATDVPVGVSATYQGVGLGVARRADGQPYQTVSTVTVSTDFNTASIDSANTAAVNLNTAATSSAPELDFSGSGTVSGSGFTATVTGTGTSGSAQGQFYGPSANEVGGTYSTSGPGGVWHMGAFGGN